MVKNFRANIKFCFRRAILQNDDVTSGESRLSHILSNDFWGTPLSHSGSHKSYRPIVTLTFRINHLVTGAAPWAYHLTNIILHCLATYLVVSIIKNHYQTRASNTKEVKKQWQGHLSYLPFDFELVHRWARSTIWEGRWGFPSWGKGVSIFPVRRWVG